MLDLFRSESEPQPIPMEDANVELFGLISLGMGHDELLADLIRQVPWRAERIVVWGKSHPQPRLIAWYGDPGLSYSYSGIHLDPLPWIDLLAQLKTNVESRTGCSFNSALLNYYRDNNDSMGMHSDDEPELGSRPTIASLSLGEERTFVMRHKLRKDLAPVRIKLSSGSLLVMKGKTQTFWKHAIEKERKPCGPRVNITFRLIVD